MNSRAAQRYAKAVLSLANEQNKAAEVSQEMLLVSKTLSESSDLLASLTNPSLKSAVKKAILNAVFSDFEKISTNLFDLLLENKRIYLLQEVAIQYIVLYNEINGIQEASVVTAVPLTPALEQKVQEKVKELTGGKATLVNTIDESILGGFILRVGDLQYNASISAKLQTLRRNFQKTSNISTL